MANAAVVYENLADAGSVRASSSVVTMPSRRVLEDPRTRVRWQSLSGSASLIVDHGSAVTWDTAALPGCIASTCRLRASNTDATGELGDLYDSGVEAVDADFGMPVFAADAQFTARYARFDLTHATLPYVAVGRVVTGARTTFTYNFDNGWSEGRVDTSIRSVSIGGQIYISERESARYLDVNFGWLSESQARGVMADIDRVAGLKRDILFIRDSDSDNLARDSIWGLLDAMTGTSNPSLQLYSKPIKMTERL